MSDIGDDDDDDLFVEELPARRLVPNPPTPIMGGLLLPNNRGFRIPYTGGEPLADWSGLAGAVLHHGSPNCNRPTDPDAAAKNWNLRIAEPKHLLKRNDPEFGITQLSAQVRFHSKQLGMDTIMYVPSRANPEGPAVNLVTSYDQVTLEHVINCSNAYRANSWDEYDIDNDSAMQIYNSASIFHSSQCWRYIFERTIQRPRSGCVLLSLFMTLPSTGIDSSKSK